MNPFKELDEASDIEAYAHRLKEERERNIMTKVRACRYRHCAGFYNVKCLHPARENAKGGGPRLCIDKRCPVILENMS